MAYSTDLRRRALDYIEKGGSKEEASQIFGITIRTLFNWIKRKKENCLAPKERKARTSHKIDNEKLKEFLKEHPDAYLREISQFLGAAISTVFYACKRLNINLKKRSHSTKKEMKKNGKNSKKG